MDHTLQICGPTQPWSVYHLRTTGGTVNLYRITQTVNREYDTYGGAVVVAASEEAARLTHPSPNAGSDWTSDEYRVSEWVNPADVTVTYLGVADPSMPAGVILSSFRAG